MTISFIIPAFNASKTIDRCLNSIISLGLSKEDYEIIVVDDHSTDNTVDIIKKYVLSQGNITLLCQPQNHRQGAARNRGLAIAQGEFIVFVDSDDETAPGVISAIRLGSEQGVDMVAMQVDTLGEDGRVQKRTAQLEENEVFSGQKLQTKHPFWFTGPVAYVYRKAFLDKTDYPFAEDVLFEDSDFVNVHLFHADRMSYCEECGYLIHHNETSTTHTISFNHVSDYAILGYRMLSFYQNVIEQKKSAYADSILEGGSYNIMRSCKNLFKLKSLSDVRSFYQRFDHFCDRKQLLGYRKPAYCWTRWTRFCVKHKNWTVFLVGTILSTHVLALKKIIRRNNSI